MEAPLVSAALIVRNEERFLDGCLDSLQGFADEIILVDTGSTDATHAIAENRGIAVHSFSWNDDFSAARNHALGLARGQWIFYIDADERVSGGASEVRQSLLDQSYLGFQVLLTPRAGTTPYWIMRLWRNHPSIRFRGIIHENIWPALTEYQAAHGGTIRDGLLEMEHFGYEDDHARKNERNLPLLEKALEADPERIFSWCHLASIHLDRGRPEDAVGAWRKAIELVRRRKYSMDDDTLPWAGLIQFEMTRQGDASELLDEALARFPHDLQFSWLKGRSLMERDRFAEAIPFFERLAQAGETGLFSRLASYDVRMLGVLAHENLATCHFLLHCWKEAVRHYDLALAKEPGRMDLRAKRSVAFSKAGSAAGK
jgi:glycosyltransferase involved in cell wall biosynthesis